MNSIVHPATNPALVVSPGSCWHASLELEFAKTARGCRLTHNRHVGPLYVQRPFYPEGIDLAHVYLLHPPGGIVSGDRLQISVQLNEGTKVLCTTPGAGRLYRARSDLRLQEQHNILTLGSGSSLEWLPQETIVFPGAHAQLTTRVNLAKDASFIGWEITSLGLPVSNIEFTSGSLHQRLEILLDGLPLLIENIIVDSRTLSLYHSACGMRSLPVSGIFVAGPFAAGQSNTFTAEVLHSLASVVEPALCGITKVGNFLVGRYLGKCSEEARRCFRSYWRALRPHLLQREAYAPNIWTT
ncbi:MAG: urease accessory protein UreD [Pseudomonadota bacterium]